jgi:hypothetical protein
VIEAVHVRRRQQKPAHEPQRIGNCSWELGDLWNSHDEVVRVTIRANRAARAGNWKLAQTFWASALKTELKHIEALSSGPNLQLLKVCRMTAAYMAYFLRHFYQAEQLLVPIAAEVDQAKQLLAIIRERKWGDYDSRCGEWFASSREMDAMFAERSCCRES